MVRPRSRPRARPFLALIMSPIGAAARAAAGRRPSESDSVGLELDRV